MKNYLFNVMTIVVLLYGSASISFATEASFKGLGHLPGGDDSFAYAVSGDGTTIVGWGRNLEGNQEAFVWTSTSGMVGLGDLSGGSFYSLANGVSGDGSVVVGQCWSASGIEAFRWTESEGMVGMGDLGIDDVYSEALDISDNGNVIVGRGKSPLGKEAFVWTSTGGMVGLGDIPDGSFYSFARGISGDGSVVVGRGSSEFGNEAFRWTESEGMVGMGDLPGGPFGSWAEDVSADGNAIVGIGYNSDYGQEPFRWTALEGMVGLGHLPGGDCGFANAVSGNGACVVGWSTSDPSSANVAFIWGEKTHMRSIKEVLVIDFGLDITGWTLSNATGISDDGLTVVGYGINPLGYTEAWVVTISEPTPLPIANADGPYTIYVGDTLTLDASGSTDEHNNIVSYLWDLDDNNSFETDAGGNAVFDVNYTYLQSLGLLVGNTYNIHLKVTDSGGLSSIATTTLTILPIPALKVIIDIKPGSCPNPVNVKSSGVLPVAILGTADFDVTTIDATSIRLAGVSPLRSCIEDVGGPAIDSNDCNCTEDGPDGLADLTLKFRTQDIVEAIGDVNYGDTLTLRVTGVLTGESPIEGADCVVISGKHKPFNKFDVNKDGVVDSRDFAIFAENWLQSSIIED
jgi:probable HAF family extracellular repeat protein